MLEKKIHKNLLIESKEFREFVLSPRTRFFCSMNQNMLLKFVHVVDQCLWIQFHETKSVPISKLVEDESLRIVDEWMESCVYLTNKYIQKGEKEVRLEKESIYLPLSMESFMDVPPADVKTTTSTGPLIDFLEN
jgi:hypothetical protein